MTPTPPPGYVLDTPGAAPPAPPSGYVLDSPGASATPALPAGYALDPPAPGVLGRAWNAVKDVGSQVAEIPAHAAAQFARTGAGLLQTVANNPQAFANADAEQYYPPQGIKGEAEEAHALRQYARAKEAGTTAPKTAAGEVTRFVGTTATGIAPVLAAGAVAGPVGAGIVGGAQLQGDVANNVFETMVAKGHSPEEAAKLAGPAGAGAGVVGLVSGGLLGGGGGTIAKSAAKRAVEHVAEGAAIGGIQSGATSAIESAATGEKFDPYSIPKGAAVGAGLGLAGHAVGAAYERLRNGPAPEVATEPLPRAELVNKYPEAPPPPLPQGYVLDSQTVAPAPPPGYVLDTIQSPAPTHTGTTDVLPPAAPDLRPPPEPREPGVVPQPVYSPDELARMQKPTLKRQAEQWGVDYDTRSATLPRIADAQERWRLGQLTPKQLWDEVRAKGLRAGSREANIETLIRAGQMPPTETQPGTTPQQPAASPAPAQATPPAVSPAEAQQKSPEPVSTGASAQVGQSSPGVPGRAASQSTEAPFSVSTYSGPVKEKAPAPEPAVRGKTQFTKAAVERKLLEYHEQQGGDQAASDDPELSQFYKSTTFYGKLPGEAKRAIENNPGLRSVLRVTDDPTAAGGEDTMASMGEDRYFEHLGRVAQNKVSAAKETAAKGGDPAMQFWSAVHDNLPKPYRSRPDPVTGKTKSIIERPDQIGVKAADLNIGQEFELNGSKFQVVEDEDGMRVLKDGGEYPDTPIEALGEQKIPVDKGTLHQAPEPEVPDDPFAGVREEPAPLPTGEKPGLFGQPTFDAATGNKTGALFHEPTEAPAPQRTGDDAKIAGKFDETATPGMFEPPTRDNQRRGFASIAPLEGPVKAAADAAKKVRDYVTIDPVPKLARVGAADAAVEHASARIAVPKMVDDLLARVFPKQYRDPEAMAKTVDVLNKDNVLAGYDDFVNRAEMAHEQGNDAESQKWERAAQAVADKHDLKAYDQQVRAAMADPETKANVERWKEHVNPTLDQLYNEVKRVDPATEREGRGRLTGARINLLGGEQAKQWAEAMADPTKPLPEPTVPEPQTANYRNPDVKRDRYDRAARFTGDYSNDARTVLTSVLGPRWNEATKLRFYDSLTKSGVAVELEPGQAGPAEIQGQPAVRLPVRVPQTDPATGATTRAERTLMVRADLAPEIRDVLNTDQRASQNVVAKLLTHVQMFQLADAASHLKNIHTVITHAQGAGNVWKDVARKMPGLTSVDAIARVGKVAREVVADTPEIRKEIAGMAAKGLIRPDYPATGIQKITKAQDLIHAADTGARVVMNRFFDNLVERGLVKDTDANRRQYVLQVGQYNRRLMGPLTRFARDSGLSPFIVAGRNFNRMGRRILVGSPGVEASSAAAAAQLRATNLLGTALLFTLPMMLNSVTTGKPGGRSGTPLGAWDLGTEGDDGKHKVIDLMQVAGLRRGLRATGLDAAIEGLRQGKDFNTILGNAAESAGNAALHPWLGPAAGFVGKALTGRQLDMRGRMEAQTIPEGGGKQYLENARAALESQNPLVYSLVRPLFQKAGLDQKPEGEGYGGDVASTFLKSPFGAAGVKDVQPGRDAAEDLADRLAKIRFGGGSMTPETADKAELRKAIVARLRKDAVSGERELLRAVADGNLSEQDAARLHKQAGASAFSWNVRSLSASDAAKVYQVATDEERKEIKTMVFNKIANSQSHSPAEKRALYIEAGFLKARRVVASAP